MGEDFLLDPQLLRNHLVQVDIQLDYLPIPTATHAVQPDRILGSRDMLVRCLTGKPQYTVC